MEKLKNAILGLFVLFAIIAFAWMSGWSPLNLIFGPQYSTSAQRQGNSREHFLNEVVPTRYPKLIRCLKDGPETIQWVAQSGEPQQALLKLQGTSGLVVETAIFVGSSQRFAASSTREVSVKMSDKTRNGLTDTQPRSMRHLSFFGTRHWQWLFDRAGVFSDLYERHAADGRTSRG